MGRPYSLDLRERVVDAAAATSRRQAAARFGVGIATAIRWAAAVEATGTVAARPQGRPRTSKLDPHEAFLRDLIDEKDDITLEEMRARLLAECDLKVRGAGQAAVMRARIVLAADAEPQATNRAIGVRLGISRQSVITWRQRFLAHRLEGLVDAPIVRTLETQPAGATHWSMRAMARQAGMHRTMVSRI